ncbi:hypothetical protein [Mesorhizobium sp. NPDC059025]
MRGQRAAQAEVATYKNYAVQEARRFISIYDKYAEAPNLILTNFS